jgi:hypothetical protein
MPYLSFTVNGQELTLSDKFWREAGFRTADILPFVKVGENELVYKIDYFQSDLVYYILYESDEANCLLTSLTYDTELAETYLFGDFAVTTRGEFSYSKGAHCYFGDFTIKKSKKTVAIQNVIKDGLPFFAGNLHLAFDRVWKTGDPTVLKLEGQFATCEIYCNGKFVDTVLFGKYCDLAGFLTEGNNKIALRLYNSNRNLLGPLHNAEHEPYNVYPGTFTCENRWENGKSAGYLDDRYCFVRFGLEHE